MDTSLTEACQTPGPIVNHKPLGKTTGDSGSENTSDRHHGCGHDGHTAIMLIVAMAAPTGFWSNNMRLTERSLVFFQPIQENHRPTSDN